MGGVFVVVYLLGPTGSGAFGAAAAVEAVPSTHTVALLEQERQELVAMSAASRTFTVVARPVVTSPRSAASSSDGSAGTSNDGGSSGGTGPASGGAPVLVAAVPDPGTAKSIAYTMMASFGFSPSQDFGCLDALWTRESNWMYDAENPSGAYGIPQALPGAKMASAGADWATDPTTQIKWGLGYIKDVYGNPCAAWSFEEANGYY